MLTTHPEIANFIYFPVVCRVNSLLLVVSPLPATGDYDMMQAWEWTVHREIRRLAMPKDDGLQVTVPTLFSLLYSN